MTSSNRARSLSCSGSSSSSCISSSCTSSSSSSIHRSEEEGSDRVSGRRASQTSLRILKTLSVKDLKKIIKDGGLSGKDCVDKESLVERASLALSKASHAHGDQKSKAYNTGTSPSSTAAASIFQSRTDSARQDGHKDGEKQTQEEKDAEMRHKIRQMMMTDMVRMCI